MSPLEHPTPDRPGADLAWWRPHRMDVGEVRRWRIGPLTLWAHRRAREWRLHRVTGEDDVQETLEVAVRCTAEEIPEEGEGVRYSFQSAPARLVLSPRLADRPVVVRPAHPLVVPSGEQALLYVSTPLWAAASATSPDRELDTFPCYRPSDTWFGPSTRVGELCYASRTSARMELAELPIRPHRAVTPIRIHNRAKDALPLERLKVPVELLALYHTPRGLWTPAVTLVRENGGDLAALQLGSEPPPEAGRGATRVAEPRQRSEGALGLRAFSRLLGLGGHG